MSVEIHFGLPERFQNLSGAPSIFVFASAEQVALDSTATGRSTRSASSIMGATDTERAHICNAHLQGV
jgi:hypothetical protein